MGGLPIDWIIHWTVPLSERCRSGESWGLGDSGFPIHETVGRVLASTRVSPLSVAKIYNIFRGLSRGFVRFYVFDKGEPITSGKTHKDRAAPPGFFLVLSGGSWYDRPVELGTSPAQMEEAF